MPGLDGFGVLERLGAERMPAVVFVTAYDAHAIRAFDVHALDYVLKPFDDARLARAIERARTHVTLERHGALSTRIRALLAEMGRTPPANGENGASATAHVSRIAVRASDRLYFVRVAEIDYFAGAGNYVELHVGERSYRIRTTISGLVDQLDPKHFVRIHRSTIVNIDRIREVQPWLGGDHIAILHGGQKLRVSRTFADELLRPMR
jgi:two-component system LytT family response regulator